MSSSASPVLKALNNDIRELAKNVLEMGRLLYSPTDLNPTRVGMLRKLEEFVAKPCVKPVGFVDGVSFHHSSPSIEKPVTQQNAFHFNSSVKAEFLPVGQKFVDSMETNSVSSFLPKKLQVKHKAPKFGLSFGGKKRGHAYFSGRVQCSACGIKISKTHLKYHTYLVHGGPGQYKKQRTVQQLKSEPPIVKTGRPPRRVEIVCEFCSAIVPRHGPGYTKHLRNGLHFGCDSCQKRFLTDFALKRHIDVRHQCYEFYRSTTTAQRQQLFSGGAASTAPSTPSVNGGDIHTKGLPAADAGQTTVVSYPCNICGQVFSTPRGRQTHKSRRHNPKSLHFSPGVTAAVVR